MVVRERGDDAKMARWAFAVGEKVDLKLVLEACGEDGLLADLEDKEAPSRRADDRLDSIPELVQVG